LGTRLDNGAFGGGQRFLYKIASYTLDPATDNIQILRIRLYVPRNFDNKETPGDRKSYGKYSSIRKFYRKPLLNKVIKTEIEEKYGRLLITNKLFIILESKSYIDNR